MFIFICRPGVFRPLYLAICSIMSYCGHVITRCYECIAHLVKTIALDQTPREASNEEPRIKSKSYLSYDDIPRQGYPIIGDIFAILRNGRRHHEYFTELHEKLGPIFRSRLPVPGGSGWDQKGEPGLWKVSPENRRITPAGRKK